MATYGSNGKNRGSNGKNRDSNGMLNELAAIECFHG